MAFWGVGGDGSNLGIGWRLLFLGVAICVE